MAHYETGICYQCGQHKNIIQNAAHLNSNGLCEECNKKYVTQAVAAQKEQAKQAAAQGLSFLRNLFK